MNFRAIWAIARKDLLETLRTLRLLIFVLLPIVFSIFYRTVFASAGDISTARVVIYDAGKSRLPQMLAQTENVRVIVVGSAEELERVVIESRAVGGIVLPPDYDAALISAQRPALRILLNGQLRVRATQFIHLIEPALRSLAGQHIPANVETLSVNTTPDDDIRLVFDLERFLLIMFLTVELTMTAVMVPASMLVEEKTQHTLKAVLAAPVSYADFVTGKGIAGLTCALFSGGIILALNGGLSGNVGLTALVLLLSATFLVEIGLLLGTLFDSLTALNTWSFVLLVPLTLPGVLIPALNLGLLNPGAGAWILHLIPTYYTVDALQWAVSGLGSFRNVGLDLLVLSAVVLLLFAATVTMLRRRHKDLG